MRNLPRLSFFFQRKCPAEDWKFCQQNSFLFCGPFSSFRVYVLHSAVVDGVEDSVWWTRVSRQKQSTTHNAHQRVLANRSIEFRRAVLRRDKCDTIIKKQTILCGNFFRVILQFALRLKRWSLRIAYVSVRRGDRLKGREWGQAKEKSWSIFGHHVIADISLFCYADIMLVLYCGTSCHIVISLEAFRTVYSIFSRMEEGRAKIRKYWWLRMEFQMCVLWQ